MPARTSLRTLSATALVAAASTAAGAEATRRRSRRNRAASDPCGPTPARLPEGTTRRVTTDDGADLVITDAGPPEAPTVVLSHCWTGSRAVWATVARRLVTVGFRVVAYDQRGHGESTIGDGIPDLGRLGHDLATILDDLDLHDVVLVGHSMGGMAVQSLAVHAPATLAARTSAVVLVSTAARITGVAPPAGAVRAVLGDHLAWTRRGRIGTSAARLAVGRSPRPAHLQLTRAGLESTTGAARADAVMAMASMDLRGALATCTVPVEIVVGSRDLLTPVPFARALAAGCPHAQLRVLGGAGHMLPLERPDDIVDAILRAHRPAEDRAHGRIAP